MPGMGAPRQFNHPNLEGVRMWPINGLPNYLAFYLTTESSIQVLRVLHGARNIERIFEQRLQDKKDDVASCSDNRVIMR